MGLREKVTLTLVTIILIQIACRHCMPRTPTKTSLQRYLDKNLKPVKNNPNPSPFLTSRVTNTPKQTLGKKSHNDKLRQNAPPKKSIYKMYNFPETEYPLDTSTRDPFCFGINSNSNNQLNSARNLQYSAINDLKKDIKMKRKLSSNRQITTENYTSKREMASPNIASGPDKINLLDSRKFPEVQYPLTTMETWGTNNWNYLPFTQEENQLNGFRPQTFNSVTEDNKQPLTKLTRAKAYQFLQPYNKLKEGKRTSTENSKRSSLGSSGLNFTKTETCDSHFEDFITASLLSAISEDIKTLKSTEETTAETSEDTYPVTEYPYESVPIPYKVIEQNTENICTAIELNNNTKINYLNGSKIEQIMNPDTLESVLPNPLNDHSSGKVPPSYLSAEKTNNTSECSLTDVPSKDVSPTPIISANTSDSLTQELEPVSEDTYPLQNITLLIPETPQNTSTIAGPVNVQMPLPLDQPTLDIAPTNVPTTSRNNAAPVSNVNTVAGSTSIIIIPINNVAGKSQPLILETSRNAERPIIVYIPSTEITDTPSQNPSNQYVSQLMDKVMPNDQLHNVLSILPYLNDKPSSTAKVSEILTSIPNSRSLLPMYETLPTNSMCYNNENIPLTDKLRSNNLINNFSTDSSSVVPTCNDQSSFDKNLTETCRFNIKTENVTSKPNFELPLFNFPDSDLTLLSDKSYYNTILDNDFPIIAREINPDPHNINVSIKDVFLPTHNVTSDFIQNDASTSNPRLSLSDVNEAQFSQTLNDNQAVTMCNKFPPETFTDRQVILKNNTSLSKPTMDKTSAPMENPLRPTGVSHKSTDNILPINRTFSYTELYFPISESLADHKQVYKTLPPTSVSETPNNRLPIPSKEMDTTTLGTNTATNSTASLIDNKLPSTSFSTTFTDSRPLPIDKTIPPTQFFEKPTDGLSQPIDKTLLSTRVSDIPMDTHILLDKTYLVTNSPTYTDKIPLPVGKTISETLISETSAESEILKKPIDNLVPDTSLSHIGSDNLPLPFYKTADTFADSLLLPIEKTLPPVPVSQNPTDSLSLAQVTPASKDLNNNNFDSNKIVQPAPVIKIPTDDQPLPIDKTLISSLPSDVSNDGVSSSLSLTPVYETTTDSPPQATEKTILPTSWFDSSINGLLQSMKKTTPIAPEFDILLSTEKSSSLTAVPITRTDNSHVPIEKSPLRTSPPTTHTDSQTPNRVLDTPTNNLLGPMDEIPAHQTDGAQLAKVETLPPTTFTDSLISLPVDKMLSFTTLFDKRYVGNDNLPELLSIPPPLPLDLTLVDRKFLETPIVAVTSSLPIVPDLTIPVDEDNDVQFPKKKMSLPMDSVHSNTPVFKDTIDDLPLSLENLMLQADKKLLHNILLDIVKLYLSVNTRDFPLPIDDLPMSVGEILSIPTSEVPANDLTPPSITLPTNDPIDFPCDKAIPQSPPYSSTGDLSHPIKNLPLQGNETFIETAFSDTNSNYLPITLDKTLPESPLSAMTTNEMVDKIVSGPNNIQYDIKMLKKAVSDSKLPITKTLLENILSDITKESFSLSAAKALPIKSSPASEKKSLEASFPNEINNNNEAKNSSSLVENIYLNKKAISDSLTDNLPFSGVLENDSVTCIHEIPLPIDNLHPDTPAILGNNTTEDNNGRETPIDSELFFPNKTFNDLPLPINKTLTASKLPVTRVLLENVLADITKTDFSVPAKAFTVKPPPLLNKALPEPLNFDVTDEIQSPVEKNILDKKLSDILDYVILHSGITDDFPNTTKKDQLEHKLRSNISEILTHNEEAEVKKDTAVVNTISLYNDTTTELPSPITNSKLPITKALLENVLSDITNGVFTIPVAKVIPVNSSSPLDESKKFSNADMTKNNSSSLVENILSDNFLFVNTADKLPVSEFINDVPATTVINQPMDKLLQDIPEVLTHYVKSENKKETIFDDIILLPNNTPVELPLTTNKTPATSKLPITRLLLENVLSDLKNAGFSLPVSNDPSVKSSSPLDKAPSELSIRDITENNSSSPVENPFLDKSLSNNIADKPEPKCKDKTENLIDKIPSLLNHTLNELPLTINKTPVASKLPITRAILENILSYITRGDLSLPVANVNPFKPTQLSDMTKKNLFFPTEEILSDGEVSDSLADHSPFSEVTEDGLSLLEDKISSNISISEKSTDKLSLLIGSMFKDKLDILTDNMEQEDKKETQPSDDLPSPIDEVNSHPNDTLDHLPLPTPSASKLPLTKKLLEHVLSDITNEEFSLPVTKSIPIKPSQTANNANSNIPPSTDTPADIFTFSEITEGVLPMLIDETLSNIPTSAILTNKQPFKDNTKPDIPKIVPDDVEDNRQKEILSDDPTGNIPASVNNMSSLFNDRPVDLTIPRDKALLTNSRLTTTKTLLKNVLSDITKGGFSLPAKFTKNKDFSKEKTVPDTPLFFQPENLATEINKNSVLPQDTNMLINNPLSDIFTDILPTEDLKLDKDSGIANDQLRYVG